MISAGSGVAYQTFTGSISAATLTFGNTNNATNGFQLGIVPEPSGAVLLVGVLGMAALRRRRQG